MVKRAYGSFLENGALLADTPTERVLPDFGFPFAANAFLPVASGLGPFAARPHAPTVVGLEHVRRWAVQRGRRSRRCARRGRGRRTRCRIEDDVGRFGTPDRRTIGTFHLAAASSKKQCDGRREEDGWAHDSPIAEAVPQAVGLLLGGMTGKSSLECDELGRVGTFRHGMGGFHPHTTSPTRGSATPRPTSGGPNRESHVPKWLRRGGRRGSVDEWAGSRNSWPAWPSWSFWPAAEKRGLPRSRSLLRSPRLLVFPEQSR